MSAPQFGKLYWGVNASLAARAVAARVEYRCYSGDRLTPTEIVEADFMAALRLGRTATRAAIREAIGAGLVTRSRSTRGDGRGVFVYMPVPRSQSEPVMSEPRTGHVRNPNRTRSQSEPDTFANKTTHVRKQDFSDPTLEPVEPKTEPAEEPEERSPERDPLTESPTDDQVDDPSAPEPTAHDRGRARRSPRASAAPAAANTRPSDDARGSGGRSPGAGPPVDEPLTLVSLFDVEPVRDIARELFDEHDRLRREALAVHGLQVTPYKASGSAAERVAVANIRARLREFGEPVCREYLLFLASEWRTSRKQVGFSRHDSLWTPSSFERVRTWIETGSGPPPDQPPSKSSKQTRFVDAAVWVPPPGTPEPPKREPRLAIPKQREARPHEDDWK